MEWVGLLTSSFVNASCLKRPQSFCDSLDILNHKPPDLNFNVACLIGRKETHVVSLSFSVS